MKNDLREVYLAPNRASAETAIGVFAEKYGAKHGKAVECLTKDREALPAFYDFPAEHWDHLRTTNPIESIFATVRHSTVRTKGSLSSTTAKLMVFKQLNAASQTWRRLNGTNQLPGHRRCQIPRWHRGHRSAGKPRRLIASSPKIPHSSQPAAFPASAAASLLRLVSPTKTPITLPGDRARRQPFPLVLRTRVAATLHSPRMQR
jgi:hypothetical protein